MTGARRRSARLLIALLTNNHALIEGVPGLAKTLTVSTLAQSIDATFTRIQFTPDLMPSDVIGTTVFDQQEGSFTFKRGPEVWRVQITRAEGSGCECCCGH